jgi:L-asparagine oxygenase
VILTDNEKSIMKDIFDKVSFNVKNKRDNYFLEELRNELEVQLPGVCFKIKGKIDSACGVLVIKNLPKDERYYDTPLTEEMYVEKDTYYSELSVFAVNLIIGEPVTYSEEKEGQLIHNIYPVKGEEGKQENTGSKHFEFHTENGFHPFKPDYLSLYCVKKDSGNLGKTITSSIKEVLPLLGEEEIELLKQSNFTLRVSSSFYKNNDEQVKNRKIFVPVLRFHHDGNIEMIADFFLMEANEEKASKAFEKLKKLLFENRVEHDLNPGELLVIDNNVSVHGRTEFTPSYDKNDRWLQRGFSIKKIPKSAYFQSESRVFKTILEIDSIESSSDGEYATN